jgi:hypothetical protein
MRWLVILALLPAGAWGVPVPQKEAAASLGDAAIEALAQDIVQACPARTDADSAAQRDACGANLAKIGTFDRVAINGTLRWGGVSHEDFDPAHNSLTTLNSLVWRKLYLSLFVFTGTYKVDVLPDESRLLRLDARLRHLDNSQFPYPFWHSLAKWRSYQQTTQVGLLFKGGKLLAGYRAKTDANASVSEVKWDGLWTTDDAHSKPRTALFDYLLSVDNPYTRRLDSAYTAMALEARQFQCEACHNPANPLSMNPLVIFNLPNQALSGRHEIVYAIDHNEMPPKQGIGNEAQRQSLLRLAVQFAKLGDEALDFEQQHGAAPVGAPR